MKKLIISIVMVTITINCFAQYTHPEECHYRLIIETESYGYEAYSSDTVCNKEYEGLDDLLHVMKILLNILAKEKEYNDVNYKIQIENITNKVIGYCGIFVANYIDLYSSDKYIKEKIDEYINEKINEELEKIKRSVFEFSELKRLNLHIKYTDKKTLKYIYTDGKDEYIFNEEELTFKKREKKKPL